jgi:hypothetical protein
MYTSRMRSMFWLTCAVAVMFSTAWGASIECSKINLFYDDLLKDSEQRLQAAVAEGMAMPGQQRNALRPKICAVSGEIVGYYNLIQVLATDCLKQGEAMGPLLDEIKEYLGTANQEVQKHCSGPRR